MDRKTFASIYGAVTWIVIISSFFINFPPEIFILLLVLIFGRGAIINKIYGPLQHTNTDGDSEGLYPISGNPVCPNCSNTNPKDAKFCQDCGTPFDREQSISYDEFK